MTDSSTAARDTAEDGEERPALLGRSEARTDVAAPASGNAAEAAGEAKVPATRRKLGKPAIWAISLAAAAVLLIAGFFALSRIAPDFTDKLLYTPEELEILNYPEDGLGLPG